MVVLHDLTGYQQYVFTVARNFCARSMIKKLIIKFVLSLYQLEEILEPIL